MKFITKKSFLTYLVLLLSYVSYSFPADPDTTVDPPAPIDSNLYVLFFLGFAFAAFYFSKRKTKA